MSIQAGKGDAWRDIDRNKWDSCPLWDNLKKKKEQKCIENNQKELIQLEFNFMDNSIASNMPTFDNCLKK